MYYYIISIVKRINYSAFSIECHLKNCDNCYCDSFVIAYFGLHLMSLEYE